MEPIKQSPRIGSLQTDDPLLVPRLSFGIALIFIFLVLTKQATGTGCPGSTAFSINGDTVKQPNREGGRWLSPSPGLHINETMPHCSQLQPLPDGCLWSKTTSHRRLNPPPYSRSPFLYMSIHTSFPTDKNPYGTFIMHGSADETAAYKKRKEKKTLNA